MNHLIGKIKRYKEVYALYGSAMYMSQCVERQLALCLATVYGPGPTKITRNQYDELIESLYKKTFGALVECLKESVDVPDDLRSDLEDAVDKRNWLAHRYFYKKAPKFLTEQGRISMIAELHELTNFFEDVLVRLKRIARRWGEEHGVTEEDMRKEMERFLEEEI